MKIGFYGADREVTGSCHYLEIGGYNLLVDCGMEQGNDVYENQELPVNAADIDIILLTHAHIDHSGLIPLMYDKGFRGKIYCTKATVDLCDIMLKDSAHIQEFEAEWRNRKAKRSGFEEFVPLYGMDSVINVLKQFVPCDYEKIIEINENIRVRFVDVGHLLGSASIEVFAKEEDREIKIVFSGDIGNTDKPLIKDPQYPESADYVVMESTYGDRKHNKPLDYTQALADIIRYTFKKGGNLVIPAFAVGRTQEMLYYIHKIKREKLLPEYEGFQVVVDSPLAVEATNVFNRNIDNCFDDEALEMIRNGINPLAFEGLSLSVTTNDSKLINMDTKPKVIISASGMCEAGRIRHHLKHNLWRKESTILFVGYQAHNTLGRAILDGAKTVKLFAETIEVRADIMTLDGFSGHADKDGLIRWLTSISQKPKCVFVVHGEENVCDEFTKCLRDEYNYNAVAPFNGSLYSLDTGEMLREGNKVAKGRRNDAAAKRSNTVFDRLVAAGRRLLAVISHNEGGANKDLAKFTDQIIALCDKWDR